MRILGSLSSHILRFVRFFLHFQKPVFIDLKVNSSVIAEKPLVLIDWQMRCRYSMYVSGTFFHANRRRGLHLVALSPGSSELRLVLRSGWRRKVYRFPLQCISVPPEVLIRSIVDTAIPLAPVVTSLLPIVDFPDHVNLPIPNYRVPVIASGTRTLRVDSFEYQQIS